MNQSDISNETYGVELNVWENTIEELRKILIKCAKRRQIKNYGEIKDELTSIDFNNYSMGWWHIIAGLLGTLLMEELEAGRPALAVLVVNNDKHIPGKGFYPLVESYLGITASDYDSYAFDRMKEVYTFYRK
jgi:hypothetical protein